MADLTLKLSKEERRFQLFYDYLQELARPKEAKSNLISNKGEHHASILLGALLDHTERNLRMYSTGLTPKLLHGYGDDCTAYWGVFQNFFDTKVPNFPDGSIKILVKTTDYQQFPPFQTVLLSSQHNPGKIEIKVQNEMSKNILDDYWGKDKKPIDFSVYDEIAYRLEYDPEQFKALASFHNKDISSELTSVFDNMFDVASPFV